MQGPKGTQAELSRQIGSKRTKRRRVFQRKAKQVPRLGGLREQGTHGLGMGNGLHWQGLSNLHFPNSLDYGIASSINPVKAEFRKWWAEARNQPHHALQLLMGVVLG